MYTGCIRKGNLKITMFDNYNLKKMESITLQQNMLE